MRRYSFRLSHDRIKMRIKSLTRNRIHGFGNVRTRIVQYARDRIMRNCTRYCPLLRYRFALFIYALHAFRNLIRSRVAVNM